MTSIYLTRQQSRAIDTIAIERYGYTGLVLMENAGRGVVDVLLGLDQSLGGDPSAEVVILCGKGNNAGDGFVIARHLAIRGVCARVILLTPPADLTGDAKSNYEILRHTDGPLVDMSDVADLPVSLTAASADARWIVDAMLGTGAQGEPRESFAIAIQWANAQSGRRLALDVPSGLDCDSGVPAECTFRADLTCTFVGSKVGFASVNAHECLGQVHVVGIGVTQGIVDEVVESA